MVMQQVCVVNQNRGALPVEYPVKMHIFEAVDPWHIEAHTVVSQLVKNFLPKPMC